MPLATLIALYGALLLAGVAACGAENTDTPSDLSAITIPLSEVSALSIGNQRPPIADAYQRYQDNLIAVEGVRLGPGLPAGLGSHPFVGLHEPPDPATEFRVLITGNVPPEHGKRYRVVGRIVPVESTYQIAVEQWQEAGTR